MTGCPATRVIVMPQPPGNLLNCADRILGGRRVSGDRDRYDRCRKLARSPVRRPTRSCPPAPVGLLAPAFCVLPRQFSSAWIFPICSASARRPETGPSASPHDFILHRSDPARSGKPRLGRPVDVQGSPAVSALSEFGRR